MKNQTYIPFIRNRYFRGKLLTAEDFLQEQQYMNDKRRLMNRWMLGAGIVAGLEVIRVDDYSISLEMGLALDYTGREILVDTPIIRKLSMIDGYKEATVGEGRESVCLYIRYGEQSMEPVHNITNRAVHTVEEPEYNKVKEGYYLYLTDDEPVYEEEQWEAGLLNEELRMIYERGEKIRRREFEQGICLAKIYLVKAGEFYMIDRMETAPFKQYAGSLPMLRGWVGGLGGQIQKLEKKCASLQKEKERIPGKEGSPKAGSDWQLAQGIALVPMADGGREGRRYYSQEIPHGLGLGNVQLFLEVIWENYSYSGAEDIFNQEEKPVEAAARVNRGAGTFVIGVRALGNLKSQQVQILWTALRRRSGNEIQPGEERIYIKPGIVNAKVHQDVKLEAVCVNMKAPSLEWSVAAAEGGIVDQDGTYHAPGKAGIYEVICKSLDSGTKASVFIIVRE